MYQTDPAECATGCRNEDAPGEPHGAASALLHRLLSIDEMRASGCVFAPKDLTAAEWIGLETLRNTRAALAQETRETS